MLQTCLAPESPGEHHFMMDGQVCRWIGAGLSISASLNDASNANLQHTLQIATFRTRNKSFCVQKQHAKRPRDA